MRDKAERVPFAEAVPNESVAEPKAAPPAPPVFRIASGKAIACARGQLDGGTEVSARDFVGGQAVLDQLVASGAVVKA